MTEDNTPSTPEQHEAIRQEAEYRRNYILWLASRLRMDFAPPAIRKAAAAELEQLVGDGK